MDTDFFSLLVCPSVCWPVGQAFVSRRAEIRRFTTYARFSELVIASHLPHLPSSLPPPPPQVMAPSCFGFRGRNEAGSSYTLHRGGHPGPYPGSQEAAQEGRLILTLITHLDTSFMEGIL